MFQSDGGGSCGQASAGSMATSETVDEKAADDDGRTVIQKGRLNGAGILTSLATDCGVCLKFWT